MIPEGSRECPAIEAGSVCIQQKDANAEGHALAKIPSPPPRLGRLPLLKPQFCTVLFIPHSSQSCIVFEFFPYTRLLHVDLEVSFAVVNYSHGNMNFREQMEDKTHCS